MAKVRKFAKIECANARGCKKSGNFALIFYLRMKENLELGQHLTQTQTLAPLQVQYVRLLEMNSAAIEDEVQRRLDENPALERSDDADGYTEPEFTETSDQLQRADYGDEDEMPAYLQHRPASRFDSDDRRRMLEGAPDEADDLATRLLQQLAEDDEIDSRTRRLAEYIVGNLDDNGRMTRTLAAIADDITFSGEDSVSRQDLLPAFEAVRSLDPAGVGAVDLRDCLLLQLKRMNQSEEVRLAEEIVDRNFELLSGRRMDKLQTKTGASPEMLDRAMAVIQSLDPKPGGSSEGNLLADRAMHITPDFVVEPDESDTSGRRFLVTLAQRVPELSVAEWHVTGGEDDPAAVFVRSRTREASEFIDLLRRRTDTLMAVMRAIVDMQADFFRTEDPALIRPMILKEIAERTGRDISVVSRATSGKYVATPGGVYPLKMFFNERPIEDSDVSSHKIQEAIRSIIDNEDKNAPLSDDALTDALRRSGMDIARRTVAKYREQMNIPNSRGRRSMTPADRPSRK